MLPLWLGAADAIRSLETARGHRIDRRRGGVAARGAGSIQARARRLVHGGAASLPRRVPPRAARAGLERRREPCDRADLRRWPSRAASGLGLGLGPRALRL